MYVEPPDVCVGIVPPAGQLAVCLGCARVANLLGVRLATPHVSCRKVTVTNILDAEQRAPGAVLPPIAS